jgi:hypothetical protein
MQSSLSNISANHMATSSVEIVANAVEDDRQRRFSEPLADPHGTDEGVICWMVAYQDKLPAARRELQGTQKLHSFREF